MSNATSPRVAPSPVARQALPSPTNIADALRFIRYARPCTGRSEDPTLPGLTAAQKAVAVEVVMHSLTPNGSGWCYAHTTRLAMLTALSESTVEKALKGMAGKGWLATKRAKVPSGRGFDVTHYRLTPVITDGMDEPEIEHHVDVARAAGAAKMDAHRARKGTTSPRMYPPQVRNVPSPGAGTNANVPTPGTVDPDLISEESTRRVVAVRVHDNAARDDNDRADVAAVVALSPVRPTLSIAGVPLPADMTFAHAAYAPAITAMLAAKMPHLLADGRAYAWSMLASQHHLGLVPIASAIYAVWMKQAGNATVTQLTTAMCNQPRIRDDRQRRLTVAWLQRLGVYDRALIDAEDTPPSPQ